MILYLAGGVAKQERMQLYDDWVLRSEKRPVYPEKICKKADIFEYFPKRPTQSLFITARKIKTD
jgi:hypothetical protein